MNAFVESELAETEPPYSRNENGRPIRFTEATHKDYGTVYTLHVDGVEVDIAKAVPAQDARGNIRLDARGSTTPRYTTLYDASRKARAKQAPAVAGVIPNEAIPTLCHQEHLTPVGVCRVCSVLVASQGQGKDAAAEPRLMPACCTEIWPFFEHGKPETETGPLDLRVYTHNSLELVLIEGRDEPVIAGDHVRSAVGPLLRLLLAHHRHPDQPQKDRYQNELEEIASWPGLKLFDSAGTGLPVLFQKTPDLRSISEGGKLDRSSRAILVDHNNCILCNRCIRSCSEVRGFHIIGQVGKGSGARIGFDLDRPMGESGCVTCGECMIHCPTGALTFVKPIPRSRPETTVPTRDVARHRLFEALPKNYLKWTEGAVVRKTCAPRKPLCEEGTFGSTAFVILKGRFDIRLRSLATTDDDDLSRRYGGVADQRTAADFLVAETSLVNNDRRSATVVPMTDDCEVWEISRDVLKMLLRNANARRLLDTRFCLRGLENLWKDCQQLPREIPTERPAGTLHRWLFAHLSEAQWAECLGFLRYRMRILRIAPGQVIIREKHPIETEGREHDPREGFSIIRAGFVEVARRTREDRTDLLDLMSPGDHFGEMALLSLRSESIAARMTAGPGSRGRDSATCRAREHVELIHVPARVFLELLDRFPSILRVLEQNALARMARCVNTPSAPDPRFREYVRQGLYQGQNLLVLDLDKCTRCQDCVRGCADSHGGVTRLILEGERFDRFLVPSACRSCHDPLCLNECPVDAIHRRDTPGSLAIVIDDQRCIGCGLCALNCPFGSIHMLETPDRVHAQLLATNCDLCESLDGNPRCVQVCPHDAAHRMTGVELGQSLSLLPPLWPY
jgi:Fe-S-cluster-containing hydrogenase component 2